MFFIIFQKFVFIYIISLVKTKKNTLGISLKKTCFKKLSNLNSKRHNKK